MIRVVTEGGSEQSVAAPRQAHHESIGVPAGLILLIGPPAAGKSSFAQAWVLRGRLDPAGVVSCDAIRAVMFGIEVRTCDDPAVFEEMDARIAARLAAGRAVVVDATNGTVQARSRMYAWAQLHGRPITALRFSVDDSTILQRNSIRTGHRRVPTADVLSSAEAFRASASREQLLSEDIHSVVDVPGWAENVSPSGAAELIYITSG
jgi:protein phosphatase